MKINKLVFISSFGFFSVGSGALSASELTFEPQGGAGHQTFVPQGGAGHQTFVPQGGAGHQTFVPQGGAGQQTFEPQGGAGHQTFVPQGGARHQTFVPQGGARHQTFVPQGGAGQQTFEPQGGAGQQTFVPQSGVGKTIHAPAQQSQPHYLTVNLKGAITSGDPQKGYIVKITESNNPSIVANGQEVWIPHDNPIIHYMRIGQKLNVSHITDGTYQIPSGQVMHVVMGATQIP